MLIFNNPGEEACLKCRKKRKLMLVTIISSFSHNAYYPSKEKLNPLTLYHTIQTFNDPKEKALENTVENFQCFLPSLFYSIREK